MVLFSEIMLYIFLFLFYEFVVSQNLLEDDSLDTIIRIYPLEPENNPVFLTATITPAIQSELDSAIVKKRDTDKSKALHNKIDAPALINSIEIEKRHNQKKSFREDQLDNDAKISSGDMELHITGDQILLHNTNLENEDLEYESNPVFMAPIEEDLHQREERQNTHKKPHNNKNNKMPTGPKIWDHWGKWSACSVTCGVGKLTRWRHCVQGGCASGEKEAQIKTCTSPAC